MSPEDIKSELKDCKKVNRYLRDHNGDRFRVFGMPSDGMLVQRIVGDIVKTIRTMNYSEVALIEVAF